MSSSSIPAILNLAATLRFYAEGGFQRSIGKDCDVFLILKTIEPVLLVHGGAGNIHDDFVSCKQAGVKLAARLGYETLGSTGNVLDAVINAVRSMELDENFNAGFGSALTWEGKVEMDAAIMNGADLNAGCVSIAQNIAHPIELARSIMQKTRHKYLAGVGAMTFAAEEGFDILTEGALVTAKSLQALEDYKKSLNATCTFTVDVDYTPKHPLLVNSKFNKLGTVGAIAIDGYGNVASATSTGGITGKMPGRIGDSSILGGGTYADNATGTVSATGHGETIMRYNVASRILAFIGNCSMSAQQASVKVLDDMTSRFHETAGVITIDRYGTIGIHFTSQRMPWAYQRGDELHYGIEKGEDSVDPVTEPKTNACQLEFLKENKKL